MERKQFFVRTLPILGILLLLTIACSLTPDIPTPQNADAPQAALPTPAALATPASDSPAAGICAEFEGTWVTITINPDIPDPRCAVIHADQKLSIVNQRGEIITVRLGDFEYTLLPGQGQTFDLPFGEYLAPGVHRPIIEPCCSPELVFEAEQ